MDPNANLEELRQLVKTILSAFDREVGEQTHEVAAHDAARLAELVEALDGWLSRGGFLPTDWKHSV